MDVWLGFRRATAVRFGLAVFPVPPGCQEQSPTPALVGDPVPHPSRQPRREPSLEPTKSLQPGLQARRQVPELTISFTSPNTHPKTDTPEDHSQATVATTQTVTGTPYKRYRPLKSSH